MKTNKILLGFAILYSLCYIYFKWEASKDPSIGLGYPVAILLFWITGGLVLKILFWVFKITLKTILDKICFIFSTPLPFIIYIAIEITFIPRPPSVFTSLSRDGCCYKNKNYYYANGKYKKREYYRLQPPDTIKIRCSSYEDGWVIDSVIHYNRDGSIQKIEYADTLKSTNVPILMEHK